MSTANKELTALSTLYLLKAKQPQALVLLAPGINCDKETAAALALVGFEVEMLYLNELVAQKAMTLVPEKC